MSPINKNNDELVTVIEAKTDGPGYAIPMIIEKERKAIDDIIEREACFVEEENEDELDEWQICEYYAGKLIDNNKKKIAEIICDCVKTYRKGEYNADEDGDALDHFYNDIRECYSKLDDAAFSIFPEEFFHGADYDYHQSLDEKLSNVAIKVEKLIKA